MAVGYLGHIVSKKGIRVDPHKLKVVVEWPQPIDVEASWDWMTTISGLS